MITVDGRWHSYSWQTTWNELEHGHLCGGILHRHPIRS
jgi:hypothetical protein